MTNLLRINLKRLKVPRAEVMHSSGLQTVLGQHPLMGHEINLRDLNQHDLFMNRMGRNGIENTRTDHTLYFNGCMVCTLFGSLYKLCFLLRVMFRGAWKSLPYSTLSIPVCLLSHL